MDYFHVKVWVSIPNILGQLLSSASSFKRQEASPRVVYQHCIFLLCHELKKTGNHSTLGTNQYVFHLSQKGNKSWEIRVNDDHFMVPGELQVIRLCL